MATAKKAPESAPEEQKTAKRAPKSTTKTVKCYPFAALNVRAEPSETAEVANVIYDGEKLDVLAAKNGWHALADGSGYVKAEFIA